MFSYPKKRNQKTEPGSHTDGLVHSGNFTVPSIPPQVATSASFEYDELGHVIAVLDGAGHVKVRYQYDANGNVTNVTDALGHTTTMTYDALGRVSKVTDALSHATTYQYDHGNRVTKVTDPRGNITKYTGDHCLASWTAAMAATVTMRMVA